MPDFNPGEHRRGAVRPSLQVRAIRRYFSFGSFARVFALAGSSSRAREYALRASSRLFARA